MATIRVEVTANYPINVVTRYIFLRFHLSSYLCKRNIAMYPLSLNNINYNTQTYVFPFRPTEKNAPSTPMPHKQGHKHNL